MLTSTVVLDDFDLSLRTSGLINLIFAKVLALDQVLVSQLRSWLRKLKLKFGLVRLTRTWWRSAPERNT
jgi:hypothetical protein